MASLLLRLKDVRFIRYVLASVGALAVDMGLFLALLSAGMLPAASGAAGYAAGIAAHWLLSSRAVFTGSVASRGKRRTRQKALFVGSAMVGLALTTLIVGAGDVAGIDPRAAKLVAIVASFTATWLLRAKIVFR